MEQLHKKYANVCPTSKWSNFIKNMLSFGTSKYDWNRQGWVRWSNFIIVKFNLSMINLPSFFPSSNDKDFQLQEYSNLQMLFNWLTTTTI